ncbi:MAG: hypothetical protein Q8P57_03790 [Candidatus Pacearchaeota archaeon]|nr:hypothetical protein [Candidatus Pacearchaeota archaeon]
MKRLTNWILLGALTLGAGIRADKFGDVVDGWFGGSKREIEITEPRIILEERVNLYVKPIVEAEKKDYSGIARHIENMEGRRTKVYDPNNADNFDEPTIGIGHYMGRGDSKETFREVLPGVNWDSVYRGELELTDDEVDVLFAHDLGIYIERTRRLMPHFDSYPEYLKTTLVDMSYRGDLVGSPKTRKLMNDGDFFGAAREYLNSREYRESVNGMLGIKNRMEENQRNMIRWAMELNTKGKKSNIPD